jgi:outer membrane protein assembly factor BamB
MSPDATRRRFLERAGLGALALAAGCSGRPESDTPTDVATPADGTDSTNGPETDGDDRTETPVPVEPLDGSWASYRADAANAGAVPDPGPADDPVERWRFAPATGAPATAAAALDGAVAYATETGVGVARAVADGGVRWRRPLPEVASVDPVAVGGTVAFVASGRLVGLAADTGAERWSIELEGSVQGLSATGDRLVAATDREVAALAPAEETVRWRHTVDGTVATPPGTAADAGIVAVGLSSGAVLAVGAEGGDDDAATGTERWRYDLGSATLSPAVAADRVYAATEDRLVALDTAGNRVWGFDPRLPIAGGPVVAPGVVYLSTVTDDAAPPTDRGGSGGDGDDGAEGTSTPTPTAMPTDTLFLAATVHALSAADGTTRWETRVRDTYNFTSGAPAAIPLSAADEDRLLADIGGDVVAFDADDGDRLWTATGSGTGRPPAIVDGVVSAGPVGVGLPDGTERWAVRTGTAGVSAPTAVGNAVYVGSDDRYLYALSATDGAVRWAARTDGRIRSSPVVDPESGTVYVGTQTGSLYAFAAADGTEAWRTGLGGQVQPPTLWDGTLFLGVFSPTLYAVDAADGSVRWRAERPDPFLAGVPAVADGTVVAGNNGEIAAFDAADGTELWSASYGEDMLVQSTPVIADGRAFVNLGDALRAFDLADGTELWSLSTGGANRPPVVRDGTVYAPTESGVVAAAAADGTRQFGVGTGSPAVALGDGTVYAATERAVSAVDATTGDRLWRDRLPARTVPVPADEFLFVGDDSGRLRAIGPDPT